MNYLNWLAEEKDRVNARIEKAIDERDVENIVYYRKEYQDIKISKYMYLAWQDTKNAD